MNRRTWNALRVLIAALVLLPSLTIGADKRPRSVLEDVAPLIKPVTYTETKIPLGELVQRVAEDTGAPLTAAKDVADEPVAVVVKDLPARELLEQLADLLDYQWSRRAVGQAVSLPSGKDRQASSLPHYEIWQDLASKQREEARRREALREVERRFRQGVARFVEVAKLSPEQIRKLWDEEQERQQNWAKLTREERQALYRRPEVREKEERGLTARSLSAPVPQALAGLLGQLTERQWHEILAQRASVVFSSQPQSGEQSLPAETLRSFRTSVPSLAQPGVRWIFRGPQDEEKTRQRERDLQEQWQAATGYRVLIWLSTDNYRSSGAVQLNVEATPFREPAPGPASSPNAPSSRLMVTTGPIDYVQAGAEQTPERRERLTKDPHLGASRVLKRQAKPRPGYALEGSGGAWRLPELLPDFAVTYGGSFISDAYWMSPTVSATALASQEPTPLFALLDRLVGFSFHWDAPEKIVRFRSRKWFFDRPHEVPLRLTRRWKERIDQHGAPSLDEYVAEMAALEEGQLQTLREHANDMGLPRDFAGGGAIRYALRLYETLSPAMRKALRDGKLLPVAQMTPAQRNLFLAFLQERMQGRTTRLNAMDVGEGAFSLTMERMVRIAETRGEVTSYRDEPVAAAAQAASPRPANTAQYPVSRLRFQFQYAPEMSESVSLTVVMESDADGRAPKG